MAYAKAVLSIDKDKIHNTAEFNGRFKHNYRTKLMSTADPEMTPQNEYDLIPMKDGVNSYVQAFNKRLKELEYYKEHGFRKNGVKGVELCLSFGSNMIAEKWDENLWKEKGVIPENFDIETWKQENIKWLKETFGEENILSAVLHMDEKSPHIHVIITPVLGGRFNSRDMFCPKKLEEYQESYANRMNKTIGLSKREKKHTFVHDQREEFYQAVNAAVFENLPRPEQDEDIEDYFERANKAYHTKLLQDIGQKRKMEDELIHLKNTKFEDDLEKNEMLQEIEDLRNLMGDSIDEMKKKIEMITFLNEGIKRFPDKEYVEATMPKIKALVDYGRKVFEQQRAKEVDLDR